MATPKTYKINRLIGEGSNLRMSEHDKAFLSDLAKVRIIATDDATANHYSHLKGGADQRLSRLVDAGLLKQTQVYQPAKGKFMAYEFASKDIAKAFGAKNTAVIGAKRTALHEVITSRTYFALGRPESFRLVDELSRSEKDIFRQEGASKPMLPDAVMIDQSTGAYVAIEADSGQYNKSQVLTKAEAWGDLKQVWAQPEKASCSIAENSNTTVFKFS